jgi:isopenicillin N synthase-like dioxygenase
MSHLTTHHTLPPFPMDIPTAPLVSISLSKLENHNLEESTSFYKACRDLGFFYLDLNGSSLGESIVTEAEELNVVQKEFFNLPNDVKDLYGRPTLDPFYCYRYDELMVGEDGRTVRGFQNYNVRIRLVRPG